MINIFGTIIEAPRVNQGQVFESLLESATKKDGERKILREFLLAKSLAGISRIEEIKTKAEMGVENIKDLPGFRSQVIDFYMAQLKAADVYEKMVLRVINLDGQFKSRNVAGAILAGKTVLLPPTFPGDHKRAESLIYGTISSAVGSKECNEFLSYRLVKTEILGMAKDLFFAINHGLDPTQSQRFMATLYELSKIKNEKTEPLGDLRGLLLKAIQTQKPVQLLHIKSVRFTYPSGQQLRILENTDRVEQEGKEGEKRIYPSEEIIFSRLENIRKIFTQNGLSVETTLIVSDPDLEYCFPPEQNLVSLDDVENAKISTVRYLEYIKKKHPEHQICGLTEFLQSYGVTKIFGDTFNKIEREVNCGRGMMINEKMVEMRVNHQYDHYRDMFGGYDRKLARITAAKQIANIMSLGMVFRCFKSTPLLALDSRGFEDQLIGSLDSDSVVKFFTQIKDPTRIER